jgi:hypothetical protein
MTSSKSKGWLYHFERRDRAAREGRHLPSISELISGMSFRNDSHIDDAHAWAERLLLRLHKRSEDLLYADITSALKRLKVFPESEDFKNVIDVLKREDTPYQSFLDRESAELRCVLYGVASGDREAAVRLAGEVASRLRRQVTNPDELKAGIELVLGLSMLIHSPDNVGYNATSPRDIRKQGQYLTRNVDLFQTKSDRQIDAVKSNVEPVADVATGPGLVVFSHVGNEAFIANDRLDKIKPLFGKKLPLLIKPNLSSVRSALMREFPYAAGVIKTILYDLVSRDYVMIRPTILAGPPGCGKTTFWIRLAELLGVPCEVYGCAGINDSSFGGTARRWNTGEPAMPVSLIINSRSANPMIVLDEIEKAGQSRYNGNLLDSLLPMLEPRTAVRFHDLYFQAPVDLSGVMFFGTSNAPSLLPKPLRDRFRILPFPVPQARDLPALVPGLLAGIAKARGLDLRWIQRLSGEEMDALASTWSGGSIRSLQRLLEGILAVREHHVEMH